MIKWLSENYITVIVLAVLAAAVAGVLISLVRKKKKTGSAGCTCGCANCPYSGNCKKAQNT